MIYLVNRDRLVPELGRLPLQELQKRAKATIGIAGRFAVLEAEYFQRGLVREGTRFRGVTTTLAVSGWSMAMAARLAEIILNVLGQS